MEWNRMRAHPLNDADQKEEEEEDDEDEERTTPSL